jgi:hypothetical protein
MPGRGPRPKDPANKVRRNADPIPTTTIPFTRADQPALPTGKWPKRTRDWWAMWGASPLTESFTSTDWDFLLDTARVHAALWGDPPDLKVAPELRIRVAKFGATVEDRARLRIQYAQADEADRKLDKPSRDRFADLHVLPPASSGE